MRRSVLLALLLASFSADASYTPEGPPPARVESTGSRWKAQFALSRPGYYATSSSAAQIPADTVYCYPYPSGAGGTLAEIGSVVSGSGPVASSKVRVAIYASDPETLYPTTLTAESDEFDFGVGGRKGTLVTAVLRADSLYYLCIRSTGSPNIAVIRSNTSPYWGIDGTTGQYIFGIQVVHTYGPYPATFPNGATLLSQTGSLGYPLVWIRF